MISLTFQIFYPGIRIWSLSNSLSAAFDDFFDILCILWIQFLKLYRGLHKLPSDCFSQGNKHTLSIQHSVCESQTTSLFVARTFGPVIIQATVPVAQILMCHKTNTVFLPHENEYVVATGSANNPSEHYTQTNKGIARRLFLFNARIYQPPQDHPPKQQRQHKHKLLARKP